MNDITTFRQAASLAAIAFPVGTLMVTNGAPQLSQPSTTLVDLIDSFDLKADFFHLAARVFDDSFDGLALAQGYRLKLAAFERGSCRGES